MEEKLQIGINESGKLVSIYNVPTGLSCNCVCPNCGARLEAKNKDKSVDTIVGPNRKIAHFAHYDAIECSGAGESAIHYIAKEVLKEIKRICLPSKFLEGYEVIKKVEVVFDSIISETAYSENEILIIPDAICRAKEKILFVEFYKSHKVDLTKSYKISKLGISTVEINLNGIPQIVNGEINRDGVKKILLSKDDIVKHWIYNKIAEENLDKIKKKKIKEEDEKRLLLKLEEEKELDRNEAQKSKKAAFISGLKQKGYALLTVYTYKNYDHDSEYNENTGRVRYYKTFAGMSKKVYCPKLKYSENKIDLDECESCQYHKSILKDNADNLKVACAYKKEG